MNGYICVYRHYRPNPNERRKTLDEAAVASDSHLLEFVEHYDERFRFFDWGDDPSFFSSQTYLGDTRHATWGVCRRNVRSRLRSGDVIIFFCAIPNTDANRTWDYYYIGFGTVDQVVEERSRLWAEKEFEPYRKFYNVLAEFRGGVLIQREWFHPYHKDWKIRSEAPYITFAPKRNLTCFNLSDPLHVATYEPPRRRETWDSPNSRTRKLERLLFIDRSISRRLRSSPTGFAHSPINLNTHDDWSLLELREQLVEFSAEP